MLVTAMKLPHLLPPPASRVTDTRCKRFPHVYTHTLARTHAPPYATTFPQGSSRAGGCERASKRIARTRKKILAERLHTRTRSNTTIYTRAENATVVVVCGVWCVVVDVAVVFVFVFVFVVLQHHRVTYIPRVSTINVRIDFKSRDVSTPTSRRYESRFLSPLPLL